LDDSVALIPGFYTGPTPFAPTCSVLTLPSANILVQRIINSANKLFFISRKIGGSSEDICKWQLVCVALVARIQTYPSCLDDG
jgi:hypothetical protein